MKPNARSPVSACRSGSPALAGICRSCFEGCMTAESTTSPREDRIPWAAMAGIIATVTVFAVAQGLTYPLLSFILERQGTTPGLIGLSAAMTPLGFVVSAPFDSGAGAARGRGAACDPVFDDGRAHPGRDRLGAGRLGLDAAALPARLLRQPALRDQRNLADLDHARATPGPHHGPLFIDRFGWLRHRPAVARPGRHARVGRPS